MARIGVFVCHCGENIGRTVDCVKVAEAASKFPGVVHSIEYKYMCSEPGQNFIKDALKEHKLTGVIVAACSPKMHEPTFRKVCAENGLNPYLCEMANIREHCSWVHEDKDIATQKAIELLRIMVEKVKQNHELFPIHVPVTKKALVIGGGIAGIQTALDIADGGHKVILVEKDPSIGGHMAQLSETFPTLDCSQCIETPKMVDCGRHPNIELYTYSEIENVEGFIGNFEVTIRQKARFVDPDKCSGCGDCWNRCPQKKIPSEFDAKLGKRTAIYIPFPQAVPAIPVIDKENCIWFQKEKCGVCKKKCPREAVDFEQEDQLIKENVGAIVVATGYDILENDFYEEYFPHPNVISGLQFERLASASGPTEGKILRPSDQKEVETIVFIQCYGSRDPAKGITYCSKICCMYTAKHAMLYKHKVHNGNAYVFYIDVRTGGKTYEEFWRRAVEEDEVCYLRGKASKIYPEGDKIIVKGADLLTASQVEVAADLVVLASAMKPQEGIEKLYQMLGISYDQYGWVTEAHAKLKPIETSVAGIFLAGSCQGPKDIPDCVSQASGAASKVQAMFSSDELEREPTIAAVNEMTCVGCFYCELVCPADAIERKEVKDREGNVIKFLSSVNEGKCQGCGSCVAICPSNSIDLRGFTDEQLHAEIDALSF